jgi:hypothetical protein
MEALGGGSFEEVVRPPLGNCSLNTHKQSQTEFARAAKLEGKNLARFSRDVVDAAIRGSFDIHTDSMERIRYHREHPPDPAVAQLLEKEAFDCALDDDEEVEPTEQIDEKEEKPCMVDEIEGLDEEISPIEKWKTSVVVHEAAVTDRRISLEIVEHPNGDKSTKQPERAEREVTQLRNSQILELNRGLEAGREPGPAMRQAVPRAISVEAMGFEQNACQ